MKTICLSILICCFAGSATRAQLIKLPKNITGTISENILDQFSSSQISGSTDKVLREYCFVIKVRVKQVSRDSVKVINVIQLQEGAEVNYLKDLEFLKRINFASIAHSKKINVINIPCYYSIVDQTKAGSKEINQYYNFWLKFNSLFVSERVLENELFTMPITMFGAIYE